MSKIIFEGSEKQIELLKSEFDMLTIEHGKDKLPKHKENYYQLENLWCIDDVQERYECTKPEALDILEMSLQNGSVMGHIWNAIDYYADAENLKEKP